MDFDIKWEDLSDTMQDFILDEMRIDRVSLDLNNTRIGSVYIDYERGLE